MNFDRRVCSHFWGCWGGYLPLEDQERFRQLLGRREFAGMSVKETRGAEFLLYTVTSAEAALVDPCEVGSANVVFLRENGGVGEEVPLGDGGVEWFEGLESGWAGVLVDGDAARLVLGRDRAGTQVVYFGEVDGVVVFSTDLRLLSPFGHSVDRQSVAEFLHFLYVPAPRTIYAGISAIMPGEILSFEGQGVNSKTLTLSDSGGAKPLVADGEDVVDTYLRLLTDAVHRNVARQGRTGLFLSGGKDSATLAVGCKLAGCNGIEAVTLGFGDPTLDEADDARAVADHLGMPLQILRFTPDEYRSLWAEVVRTLGQPMGDFAVLPIYAAIRALRGEFDVYWDGTGTDQPLGCLASSAEEMAWHVGRRLPLLKMLPWGVVPKELSYRVSCLQKVFSRPREEQFVSWNGFTAKELNGLTGERGDFSDSRLYSLYGRCVSADELRTVTSGEIWAPETSIRKVMQVAGSFGVAARYPFRDRRLERFSRELPMQWKVQGRTNKIVIRELMARHLPERILKKPRGAFNFPKRDVLTSNGFECVQQFLSPRVLRSHGLVDEKVAQGYVDRYVGGDWSLEDRIWALLMLHTWLETRDL